jgi:hypothetical protein
MLCKDFAQCSYVDYGGEAYVESILQNYAFTNRLCAARNASHTHCCTEDMRDSLLFLRLKINHTHELQVLDQSVTQALGRWASVLPRLAETDDELLRSVLRGTACPWPAADPMPEAQDVVEHWRVWVRVLRRNWFIWSSLSVTASFVHDLRRNAMPRGWPPKVGEFEFALNLWGRRVFDACRHSMYDSGSAVHTAVHITLDGQCPWTWDGSAAHHHTPAELILNLRRVELVTPWLAVGGTRTPSPPRGERKRAAESPPEL